MPLLNKLILSPIADHLIQSGQVWEWLGLRETLDGVAIRTAKGNQAVTRTKRGEFGNEYRGKINQTARFRRTQK